MLRCLADLYVQAAARLSPSHIDVFDGVLVRLMERMEARALAELSTALAAVTPAPPSAVRRLAQHDNPAVAVPVLLKSSALDDTDLIEIAHHCSQQHLTAVANRQNLSEALTETVLTHAGKDVSRVLARNLSARFSQQGFAALLATAERDDQVAESLGARPDLPADMLHSLIARASETVRTRLMKSAPPQLREKVQAALAGAPVQTARPKSTASNDYADAKAAVIVLNKGGKLSDSSVNRFAIRREYPNVIAALTLLSGADLEVIAQLMEEESGSGLIIACRGSRLNWQTTAAILNNRRVPPLAKAQLDQLKEVFEMLYVSAAQYTIRFEPPVNAAAKPRSDNKAMAAVGGH